jgi:hypothetical protein
MQPTVTWQGRLFASSPRTANAALRANTAIPCAHKTNQFSNNNHHKTVTLYLPIRLIKMFNFTKQINDICSYS